MILKPNLAHDMKKPILLTGRLLLTALLLTGYISTAGQPLSSKQIDSLAEKTMKTFDVPGIAVAVVKDDRIIHLKGYGVRSLNTKQKVDENTLFAIASNSKAFTSAALGMLVDEKKISWDDRVIDYIPEFRLYSPYVTDDFRIRDLLTHRSGLGLGAGDLMIWPGLNDFTLKDIIHNLRYLKPVSSFRTKYDYDNLMFIVAGEIVSRASGMSWEDFIETRIMKPLGMTASAAAFSRLKNKGNVIDPHAPVNGVVQVIDRDFNFNEVGNAAGGIYSNISDMCKWIIMQMNDGRYGLGLKNRLFSEEVHNEMWAPQTIIRVSGPGAYNTHFASYGLGWSLSDVKGYKQVGHTGGLAGIVTQVTLIPELKLGIIVFTNQQSGAAFNAISSTIKDSYFGIRGVDRVKQYRDNEVRAQENAGKITGEIWKEIGDQMKNTSISVNDTLFTGTYTDSWFGDVTISVKNGKLWFDSKRSLKLTGEMIAYKGNTFIVKWNDRSMDADAYVMFCLDKTGKASGMKMEAISPMTDFSYDFKDLDFIRSR
jgi:CubicO group peptidase (beta-lactamase class C family)